MYKLLVITHVVAGIFSLIVGIIAMRARKGGSTHRKAGLTYYYAMIYVCISAIVIQFFHFIPFLALISIFSLYFVLMGKWSLRYKNYTLLPSIKEKITMVIFTITGVLMIAYAVFGSVLSIIILIFGIASVVQGTMDLKQYHKANKDKNWWLLEHISKIGGSYIAAVTAFIVNNNEKLNLELPDILIWIGPGIIGGFIINQVSKRYDRKRHIEKSTT